MSDETNNNNNNGSSKTTRKTQKSGSGSSSSGAGVKLSTRVVVLSSGGNSIAAASSASTPSSSVVAAVENVEQQQKTAVSHRRGQSSKNLMTSGGSASGGVGGAGGVSSQQPMSSPPPSSGGGSGTGGGSGRPSCLAAVVRFAELNFPSNPRPRNPIIPSTGISTKMTTPSNGMVVDGVEGESEESTNHNVPTKFYDIFPTTASVGGDAFRGATPGHGGAVAGGGNMKLADATLRTSDGYTFPIHRQLLSDESDYFKALFTSPLHPSPLTDIVIYNIRGEMLSLLLDFIYTREMWLSDSNVLPIFEAADYLSLLKIRNKCCEFIENQLEELNCLGIRKFAQDWFCPDLERTANQYIMRNFVDIAQVSEELLELSLPEVASLFSDDELNVKNEEVVWEAALRWIKHDEAKRRCFIVELLRTVRTGLMDTQYFMEKVKESTYVQGTEGCRPIVIETLRFLYDLEVITERDGEIPTPSIARPRIPHEILFAIGGWSGGSPTSFIETYDTRADRWIRVSEVDPMGPRAYHGTVAIGFKIYVIGGFDGVDYFSSCRVFDAVTKNWKYIAPMYNRRCYVSVALLDGDKIYAMGGYDGQHRQNSCERYDPQLNQWSQICPMNCQRSDASATTLRNVIYICGGFNGVECLNSCECYDPEINQWTMILPMRNRRSGVSCIAYNEQIYVVGGFNGVSRMCSGEKYNPDTNTWTTIPDMYNPRSNFAIEVIDDLLFCIGGFTGTSTTFNVECYDQKTNEWYEATDMNIYRSALAACVIPGLPNTKDYIHPHRDRLMEEKRQRLLVLQQQQGSYIVDPPTQQQQQQ